MKRDFTYKIYRQLLETFLANGYKVQGLGDFIESPESKVLILRHDVDRLPGHSLRTARIEHELGIHGSYYFRIVKESFDEAIIREIAALGHEIGYHYEDLTLSRGDLAVAVESFQRHLQRLREFYPVKTLCMHGSPLSKWDNLKMWETCDYKQYGLIAEPYYDLDFNKILYLTDTGRAWNNQKMSVRDRVSSQFTHEIKKTFHMIEAVKENQLPHQVMINFHPERWDDSIIGWTRQLILQNLKNIAKKMIVRKNQRKQRKTQH